MSVRQGDEAEIALCAGADVLDVKAPERGSLGRAEPEHILQVVAARNRSAPHVPVSVALGELAEWVNSGGDLLPYLPNGVQYAKLGLAGLGGLDWFGAWQSLKQTAPPGVQWVAVAYADAHASGAPSIEDVIEGAIAADCQGLLIDTALKDSGRLLEHLTIAALTAFVERLHSAGLFLAVAGRLQILDLPKLAALPADIVAIRSAACRNQARQGELEALRIVEFRQELHAAWESAARL